MEVKDILRNLREKNHLTQEQMAERIGVTRQAVSRWETGMTQPNPELLKVLSREFGVSINTLLGSPRTLYCQCCGMPLSDDAMISREADGSLNEDYCKMVLCRWPVRIQEQGIPAGLSGRTHAESGEPT